MNSYSAGLDVTVSIPLEDASKAPYVPVLANHAWIVRDETGQQILDGTVSLGPTDTIATIAIPAAQNAITGRRGIRTVRLTLMTDDGTVTLATRYVLEEISDELAVPTVSAQTFEQALLLGLDMGSLGSWNDDLTDDGVRQSALVEAHLNLARLRFLPWGVGARLEGDDAFQALVCGDFTLNELTTDQWALMPADFVFALRRAQLIEANRILEDIDRGEASGRDQGLISKTVGESSMMWRTTAPLRQAVARDAMNSLAGFLDMSVRTARV